jgi:hypothetical protein
MAKKPAPPAARKKKPAPPRSVLHCFTMRSGDAAAHALAAMLAVRGERQRSALVCEAILFYEIHDPILVPRAPLPPAAHGLPVPGKTDDPGRALLYVRLAPKTRRALDRMLSRRGTRNKSALVRSAILLFFRYDQLLCQNPPSASASLPPRRPLWRRPSRG